MSDLNAARCVRYCMDELGMTPEEANPYVEEFAAAVNHDWHQVWVHITSLAVSQ
jgi:hypothetical protein